jgi:hypothetical protein
MIIPKQRSVRDLQLFRKERGLARRAEGCKAARSSAASGGIIADPGECYKYFVSSHEVHRNDDDICIQEAACHVLH